jgi:hypothetical protein
MDTLGLSKTGFTIIRNLLQGRIEGGTKAAEQLAEGLHNLPEPGNDFLAQMTTERLNAFVNDYPQFADTIGQHVELNETK